MRLPVLLTMEVQTGVKTVVLCLCLFIEGCLSDIALDDHCNDDIPLPDADKLTVANWTSLHMRGTCSVSVTAPPLSSTTLRDNQLMFIILDLLTPGAGQRVTWGQETHGGFGDGQPCPHIRLDIADAATGTMITPEGGLCGQHLPSRRFVSSGHGAIVVLTSNVTSDETSQDQGSLRILAVRFHTNPCDDSKEFECDNNRCISVSLQCNGDDDCGDDSDETDGCLLSTTVIAIIAIISGVLVVAVVSTAVIVVKRGREGTSWGGAGLVVGASSINDDWSDTSHLTKPTRQNHQSYGATSLDIE